MHVTGPSIALDAIQRSMQSMNRAAQRIARTGLSDPVSNESPSEQVDGGNELIAGAVESLVARSQFAAAVRLAQVANDNVFEALRLGGHLADAGLPRTTAPAVRSDGRNRPVIRG